MLACCLSGPTEQVEVEVAQKDNKGRDDPFAMRYIHLSGYKKTPEERLVHSVRQNCLSRSGDESVWLLTRPPPPLGRSRTLNRAESQL